MIHYVCKYTPIELFKGFGEECAVLEEMPENFEMSDQIAHANLCGFGKSVIQAVLEGKADQLVLVIYRIRGREKTIYRRIGCACQWCAGRHDTGQHPDEGRQSDLYRRS